MRDNRINPISGLEGTTNVCLWPLAEVRIRRFQYFWRPLHPRKRTFNRLVRFALSPVCMPSMRVVLCRELPSARQKNLGFRTNDWPVFWPHRSQYPRQAIYSAADIGGRDILLSKSPTRGGIRGNSLFESASSTAPFYDVQLQWFF